MSWFRKWLGFGAEEACERALSALGRRDSASAASGFKECADTSRRSSTVRIARFHLAECHTRLAEAAWREGDCARARDEIEVALAYAKPTPERHLVAAQIALRLGEGTDADFHLDAALALAPSHEHALALRALTFYEAGRPDEAMARVEALPPVDGRLRRFREAHARGDRDTATAHLLAVAAGYPESLL